MVISFCSVNNLFADSDPFAGGAVGCTTCNNGSGPFLVYQNTGGTVVGPMELKTLSVCNFVRAIGIDIENGLVQDINSSLGKVSCTINQTLDVLRCLGFEKCTLTGPSACCVTAGNPQPSQIVIRLPKNLIPTSDCSSSFRSMDGFENGSIDVKSFAQLLKMIG